MAGYQESLQVITNKGNVLDCVEVECSTDGVNVDVVETRARGYVGVKAKFEDGERARGIQVKHPSGTMMGIL